MEQTSYRGNKTGITSLIVLLLLVSTVTFTSFRQTAKADLSLSRKKYSICKAQNEELNRLEITGQLE